MLSVKNIKKNYLLSQENFIIMTIKNYRYDNINDHHYWYNDKNWIIVDYNDYNKTMKCFFPEICEPFLNEFIELSLNEFKEKIKIVMFKLYNFKIKYVIK